MGGWPPPSEEARGLGPPCGQQAAGQGLVGGLGFLAPARPTVRQVSVAGTQSSRVC